MTQDLVLEIFTDAIKLAFILAAPVLVIASVVGLAIALMQAASQVHEQTITFAPKAIAVTLGLLAAGSWMMNSIGDFMRHMFDLISSVGLT